MSDPQNVSTAMEAAAQAAGTGDFVSAERELRRAFALQEAALGSSHPDLANTLNNLGVVAERLNKPVEAESCYRRAYAIATGVLQPDHPFVVMSAKNLRDFCDARGIPFERPDAATPPAPGAAAQPRASWPPRKPDPSPGATAAAPVQTPSAPRPTPSHTPAKQYHDRMSLPPSLAKQSSVAPRTIAIAAVVLGAIVIAGLWTMRSAPASQKDASIPPSSTSSAAPATEPATAQPAAARPPIPAPVEQPTPAPPPAATAPADSQPTEQKSVPKTRPAAAAHDAVAIVTAQLCRPLATSGNWTCTPASSKMTPGVVFFYTRVISAADTTIEHRWYRNDRLHQNVTLQVRANGAGYRTYSRTTISPERAGDWRVELRAADGTVLHEERFSIAQ